MGKHAPPPADYVGAAEQQGRSSRPNVSTSFGSQSFSQGPDGQVTMTSQLSPELQKLFGRASGFDFANLGQMQDGSAARQQAIDSAYQQATSRLNPQWAQRETQLRSQLANQGLDANSQASRAANQQLGQARNDAYSSAMASAIAQGQAAGDSVFRNNMLARQQSIAEALGTPQIGALQQMQGFLNAPNFRSDPTQYLAATRDKGEADWRKFQFDTQSDVDAWQSGLGTLAQLAPYLFMLSDERAKTDIERLPVEALPGVPFARWTYRHDDSGKRYLGVVAQDMERAGHSRWVATRPDGLKAVNYGFLEVAK